MIFKNLFDPSTPQELLGAFQSFIKGDFLKLSFKNKKHYLGSMIVNIPDNNISKYIISLPPIQNHTTYYSLNLTKIFAEKEQVQCDLGDILLNKDVLYICAQKCLLKGQKVGFVSNLNGLQILEMGGEIEWVSSNTLRKEIFISFLKWYVGISLALFWWIYYVDVFDANHAIIKNNNINQIVLENNQNKL